MSRPTTRPRRPSRGRPPRGDRPRGGSGRPATAGDAAPGDAAYDGRSQSGYDAQDQNAYDARAQAAHDGHGQGGYRDGQGQGGYDAHGQAGYGDGQGPGGYDAQAQGGRPGARTQGKRPQAKRGPSARTYFGWAVGLVVLLVVGVGALVVGTHDSRAKPGADDGGGASLGATAPTGATPSTYSSSPSGRAYTGIEKRSADAAPLTTGEAFPPDASTVQVSRKARLTLKGKELGSSCPAAVWGAATAKAVWRAGCTQVARTLYADTAHGYALSVTVFNLADVSSANTLVDALGQGSGGGFVRPLGSGSGGALGAFGQNGYGAARGVAMGHFAVVAWAQRLSGSGDAASAAKDETLLSILIEGQKAPAVLDRAARTP
ncbi:hypothetical protein [Actinomadura harenae]|uniref:Uncharacterized protein n=1 Tax=Actinomadura harenae TaxID=2483351 RepID=A0A3M2LV80_9ACTN|nr:hypothetical protein [Actinomadura harenae]RMI41414.1 hypothetical protein EBO15_23415 [Actinomadura harenae]